MMINKEQKKLPLWINYFPYIAIVLLCISIIIFFKGVLSIESEIRQASALRLAENYIQAIESFRTLYTSRVVEPFRKRGIEVTHDYHNKELTIPLPATLSMELGEHIAKNTGQNLIFRLYSKFPFPWRKEGGVHDDFERQAYVELTADKLKPFSRIEERNGKKILRYAKADIMRESCVACHNSHLQTPKSDWKVGDLRGILEISIPLSGYQNKQLKALHETRFALIMFSFFLLGILIVAGRVIKSYLK